MGPKRALNFPKNGSDKQTAHTSEREIARKMGDRTKIWTVGAFASRLPLTQKNISLMRSINYLMLRLIRHEFSYAAAYITTSFHRNSLTFASIRNILWTNSRFSLRRTYVFRKKTIRQTLAQTKSVQRACQNHKELSNTIKFRNKWPKI